MTAFCNLTNFSRVSSPSSKSWTLTSTPRCRRGLSNVASHRQS
jgi:hypothetical protein